MGGLFGILIMALVLPMVVSDFRHREVAVGWLVLFGAGCMAFALNQSEISVALGRMAGNILLMGLLAAGVFLWLRFRKGSWMNPLREYVGAGDVWFLVCLTPLWDMRELLWFLILSLVATLAGWGVYRSFACRSTTIPLVGTLGIAFCFWWLYKAWAL